jgi:hypothetical protein
MKILVVGDEPSIANRIPALFGRTNGDHQRRHADE